MVFGDKNICQASCSSGFLLLELPYSFHFSNGRKGLLGSQRGNELPIQALTVVEFPSLLLPDHLMSGWERMLVACWFGFRFISFGGTPVLFRTPIQPHERMSLPRPPLAKLEVRRCLAFCFWIKGYKRLCLNIVPPVLGFFTNMSFFSYFSEYHFGRLSHYLTWFTVVLISSRVRDGRYR